MAERWDGVVRISEEALAVLAERLGGSIVGDGAYTPARLVPVTAAGKGDLAPVLATRFLRAAREAAERGAALLVDASIASRVEGARATWVHDHAAWAMAGILDHALVTDVRPLWGADCSIAPTAVIGSRVVIGARVTIGPGAVIGHPGFGWAHGPVQVARAHSSPSSASGPGGAVRAIPQLGGVFIEDDVFIGPLSTVDAGTLAPTRIRRGAKLDAHVHVGHNCDIGEGAMVAAQSGLAGSVTLGRGVLVGGQAGFADHVAVGEGARVAAKSGVIGDVPAGAIVAGYPAVPRTRWLRALARLYRGKRPSG